MLVVPAGQSNLLYLIFFDPDYLDCTWKRVVESTLVFLIA